jgi:hypothetical protein
MGTGGVTCRPRRCTPHSVDGFGDGSSIRRGLAEHRRQVHRSEHRVLELQWHRPPCWRAVWNPGDVIASSDRCGEATVPPARRSWRRTAAIALRATSRRTTERTRCPAVALGHPRAGVSWDVSPGHGPRRAG